MRKPYRWGGCLLLWLAVMPACLNGQGPAAVVPEQVALEEKAGQVAITIGGKPAATYIYEDPKIARPFLAHVRAPNGQQVTRHHPPQGQDSRDHDTMHPGIWLAFGDVNRADFWRNKGRVEHERFAQAPRGGKGEGTFTVVNRYRMGVQEVCRQSAKYTVSVQPQGTLWIIDSTFTSETSDLDFGAQEEMGLGVRVATPLTVQAGGRILDAEGRQNEKQVWGRQADWCDYSGQVNGQRLGMMIMPDPGNARRCWFHARDYGVLVANPFGPRTGGAERTVVKKGESLRLCFGVLVYSAPADRPLDLKDVFEAFRKRQAR